MNNGSFANPREAKLYHEVFKATAALVSIRVPNRNWLLKIIANLNKNQNIFKIDYLLPKKREIKKDPNFLVSNRDGLYNNILQLTGKTPKGRVTVEIKKKKQKELQIQRLFNQQSVLKQKLANLQGPRQVLDVSQM